MTRKRKKTHMVAILPPLIRRNWMLSPDLTKLPVDPILLCLISWRICTSSKYWSVKALISNWVALNIAACCLLLFDFSSKRVINCFKDFLDSLPSGKSSNQRNCTHILQKLMIWSSLAFSFFLFSETSKVALNSSIKVIITLALVVKSRWTKQSSLALSDFVRVFFRCSFISTRPLSIASLWAVTRHIPQR